MFAGLTVAAVAVPQAMAYALAAGLPAEYGLYTAIVMTTVGALFDSSRQLINGPTNAISIAVLSVISIFPSVDEKIQAAVLLAFMVGVIQLIITAGRLGDLTRFISHSVIVGFTLGASALLVLDQTKNVLGLKAMGGVHDHFVYRFWLTMTEGGPVHLATLSIALGTIALVVGLRWLKDRFGLRMLPELLVTVLAMATVVAWLGLEAKGVRVVGEIPSKLPTARLPQFNYESIRELSTGALAIAVLGLLEALAMAKAIAAHTQQKLNMNQQCLSEGLANLTGSFFQCMPGSGSLTRSAINQQSGAISQWSGVVSAAAVALIVMAFAPYARLIPRAALAGILIVTAWKMIDWKALLYHVRVTRFDSVILWVTAFSAVAVSIEFCVLIGVVMSSLLTVGRAGRMLLTEFTPTPDGTFRERFPDDVPCNRVLIYGLEGEMFFGASAAIERHFERIEKQIDTHTRFVVLRLDGARNADAIGINLLKGFIERARASGIEVLLCGVRPGLAKKLARTKLGNSGENIFRVDKGPTTSAILAIRHACKLIGDPCVGCPSRTTSQDCPSLASQLR